MFLDSFKGVWMEISGTSSRFSHMCIHSYSYGSIPGLIYATKGIYKSMNMETLTQDQVHVNISFYLSSDSYLLSYTDQTEDSSHEQDSYTTRRNHKKKKTIFRTIHPSSRIHSRPMVNLGSISNSELNRKTDYAEGRRMRSFFHTPRLCQEDKT